MIEGHKHKRDLLRSLMTFEFQNISQILYGFYKFTVLRNKITSTFSTYNKKYAV